MKATNCFKGVGGRNAYGSTDRPRARVSIQKNKNSLLFLLFFVLDKIFDLFSIQPLCNDPLLLV
jgi:hypothetical protein